VTTDTGIAADDHLGAFCRDNAVALKASGNGVLDGKTFGVKDVLDIEGTVTGFGNPDWLATHLPATRTASVISTLLDAGTELLGRTLSDELTYSLTGENPHYGTPINPAASDRIPGGSSSGSASAVAGELVDFSIGTDCGGSIRIPASYCGIIGVRPTHGTVAVDGVIPFAESFDVVGWFTRDAGLSEQIGELLLHEPALTGALPMMGVVTDALEIVPAAVQAAFGQALEPVSAALGSAPDVNISGSNLEQWFEVFRIIQGAEIWANRRQWIETSKPHIGDAVRERLQWASSLSPADVKQARAAHDEIKQRIDEGLSGGQILCLPTSPRAAPKKTEPTTTIENTYRVQAMRLLCIAGLGGLPQVSLPLATLDGLPLGVSLIGARNSDMQLLAAARAIYAAAD
jgi:amidase